MAATTPSTQVPDILLAQFDQVKFGDIPKSVNLFRGTTNVTLELVKLPGRNGSSLTLSMRYGSDIQTEVDCWALDAPTGVLGLGWSLPLERVVLVDAPNALTDPTYAFVNADSKNPLIRTDDPWLRGELDASLAPVLEELVGKNVSVPIQEAFGKVGLRLSASATIAATSTPKPGWIVDDPVTETIFRVEHVDPGTSALPLFDVGEGYQGLDYSFWQIRFYRTYNRWEITREDGSAVVYGGGLSGDDPERTQHNIRWGVKWGGEKGSWSQPSSEISTQLRYARAWNRTSVRSVWGDEVRFAYNDPELCGPTLQAVGSAAGQSYTKATYLTQVTDPFGRTLKFAYCEKTYEKDQREYIDPHRNRDGAFPTFAANAYQDTYETRFLDSLVVYDDAGQPLRGVLFDYGPLQSFASTDPSSPSYASPAAYPFTFKRLLRSIQIVNAAGEGMPPIAFEYWGPGEKAIDGPGPFPGALESITYPTGARVTYTYQELLLDICKREQTSVPPQDWEDSNPRPAVYLGPDYAVAVWSGDTGAGDAFRSEVDVTVYTWNGRWIAWRPDPERFPLREPALKGGAVRVDVATDFFVLSYEIGPDASSTYVYFFHKDPRRTGNWFDTVVAGEKGPIVLRDTALSQIDLVAGEGFVAVAHRRDRKISPYVWTWQSASWSAPPPKTVGDSGAVYVTASHNVCVALHVDATTAARGTAYAFHVDALSRWVEPRVGLDLGPLRILGRTVLWSSGDTLVVASFLTKNTGVTYDYSVVVLQWDAEYALRAAPFSFHTGYSEAVLALSPAAIVGDRLVASGPNVLRYDGVRWHEDRRSLEVVRGSPRLWFAYGVDFAIKSTVPTNPDERSARLLVFSPDDDAFLTPVDIKGLELPPGAIDDPRTAYYPTAAADYFTVDRYLYSRFRSPSAAWRDSSQKEISTFDGDVDSRSVLLQPAAFVSYLETVEDPERHSQANVLVLSNGNVTPTSLVNIEGEQYYTNLGAPPAPGSNPQGESTLVTFPTPQPPHPPDFEHALSFTLRRVAGRAITGDIVSYPVTQVSVWDGTQSYETTFEYDRGMAACDPTGAVVKHYHAYTRPGGDAAVYGEREAFYHNNVPPDAPTKPGVADVLDGLMIEERAKRADGTVVASTKIEWEVYAWRGDLRGPGRARIRGAYVRMQHVVRAQDGVEATEELCYVPEGASAPVTGGVVTSRTTFSGSGGQIETQTRATRYAHASYDVLGWQNRLSCVEQQTLSTTPAGGASAPIESEAMVYSGWLRTPPGASVPVIVHDVATTYRWQGGAPPTFTAWHGGPPGAQWVVDHVVRARDEHGQELEGADATGVVTSVVYDDDAQNVVAMFVNASVLGAEASYYGAEDYEREGAWQVPSTVAVVTGDAHTGAASLGVPAGQGGPRMAFTPQTQGQTYLFTFWYKVPAGATGAASWTVTVMDASGAEVARIPVPLSGPQGVWTYGSAAVPLYAYAGKAPLTIEVAFANRADQEVLLDDLRTQPLVVTSMGSVYDGVFRQPIARLGTANQTFRTVYDAFRRPVVQVGPTENVTSISAVQLSRERNAAFSPTDPNNALEVLPQGGGSYERFGDGEAWRERWATKGTWTASDGVVTAAAGPDLRLTATGPLARFSSAYLQLTPTTTPSAKLGLRVGASLEVAWSPAASAWELSTGSGATWTVTASSKTAPAPSAGKPQEWLLLVAGVEVLFYVAGGQALAATLSAPPSGPVEVFASQAVAATNLAVFLRPQTKAMFTNAVGSPIQEQDLDEGDCIVAATLYDAQARDFASTKRAPGRTGGGDRVPLLAYRPTFVTGYDAATGTLAGDVARYYDGRSGASNDAGYPFRSRRYEPSPLARPIEVGLPGPLLSIAPPPRTGGHHTTTMAYGASSGRYGLPAGRYLETTVTAADGVRRRTVRDVTGRRLVQVEEGPSAVRVTTAQRAYDLSGLTLTEHAPNAFVDGRTPGHDFRITRRYDPLGRLIRTDSPADGGTELRFYDAVGRLRIVETAAGRAAPSPYVLYMRYDRLGRMVERGTAPHEGDPADLAAKALDPSWPPTPPTRQQQIAYDGDGSVPEDIGYPTRVTTHAAEDAGPDVTETLHYDADGDVTRKILELVHPQVGGAYEAAYGYDNLGNVIAVTYPVLGAGGAPLVVRYGYDLRGQLARIGTAADATAWAAYTYTPEGAPATAALGPEGAAARRTYTYSPPGQVTSIAATAYTESLAYTPEDVEAVEPGTGAGSYVGTVGRASHRYASGTGLTDPQQIFRYDSARRLIHASDKVPAGSLEAVVYDPNGNIQSLDDGGITKRYAYTPATNRVASVGVGASGNEYEYDADGRVRRATGVGPASNALTITRDHTLQLARTIAVAGGATLELAYGDRQRRVLKQVSDGGRTTARLYLYGASPNPLAEVVADGAGATLVQYVYDGAQLAAVIGPSGTAWVLADHLRSTRAVVDAGGEVLAAFDYAPFGATVQSYGQAGALDYLYTGQELEVETGLYNYRARLYDPRLARFYEIDPVLASFGPYSYVGNDPLSFTDPTGALSAAAGGILGGLEILAGVIVDVVSAGTLEFVGAALIGAGVNAVAYSIANRGSDFDARLYGLAQAAGAVAGLVAGAGSTVLNLASKAVVTTVAEAAGNAAGRLGSVAGAVAQGAVRGAAGAARGAVANSAGTAFTGAVGLRPQRGVDVGIAAAAGAIVGGLGGVAGLTAASRPVLPLRTVRSVVSGGRAVAGGASTALVDRPPSDTSTAGGITAGASLPRPGPSGQPPQQSPSFGSGPAVAQGDTVAFQTDLLGFPGSSVIGSLAPISEDF